jgi:predicted nucleic acid-binding protein
MLVVSDASPVNILIRIGQIDVLPALFKSVVVPTSVAEEMSRPSTPQIVREWTAKPPAWFSVRTPSSPVNHTDLRHRGERDAISLAQEIRADALLLDEEKAGPQAIALGLAVIGTIGVLQRAADQGLIPDLGAVHDLLRGTSFRVSDAILKDSLARHLSNKRSAAD